MNNEIKKMDDISKDFRNFLYVIWKHLMLPNPTPVQYEIADYLQDFAIRRKVIEGFRGVGKSWVTSALTDWILKNDPNKKILVVSASKSRADDFSNFTKRLISEVPMLKHLKATDAQRDSMIAFDVAPARASHAPSVKSVGIFGQMTGSRADVIIADDVEVPNNSYTQDMRDKLIARCMEFESILKPNGNIIYLGTPQTEESIYNKLKEKGYERRIWTARYPDPKDFKKFDGDLAPNIAKEVVENPELIGHATDPKRFTDIDLMEREISYGRSAFALQFMLDTSLSDALRYPLRLSDLIVTDVDTEKAPIAIYHSNDPLNQYSDLPSLGFSGDRMYRPLKIDDTWKDYEMSALFIDPAGRGKDETAYFILKFIHGYIYLVDGGGYEGGYTEKNLKKLAGKAKEHKVSLAVIEGNFGDGMFARIFQPILNRIYPDCGLEEVKHHTNKEMRIIDTLEPVMNRHRLVINFDYVKKDVAETYQQNRYNYSLFYQMTHITKEKGAIRHDDRLDCLAMGVNYFLESMSRDEIIASTEHKEELVEMELERFMEHAVGKDRMPSDDIRYSILH